MSKKQKLEERIKWHQLSTGNSGVWLFLNTKNKFLVLPADKMLLDEELLATPVDDVNLLSRAGI